jgi:hypothetical protein
MEKELKSIFDVGYDYIRKTKLEVQELQKKIDERAEKIKSLQKALIIIEEHTKYNSS